MYRPSSPVAEEGDGRAPAERPPPFPVAPVTSRASVRTDSLTVRGPEWASFAVAHRLRLEGGLDTDGVAVEEFDEVELASWRAMLIELSAARTRYDMLGDVIRGIEGRMQDFLDEVRELGTESGSSEGEE